MDFCGGTSGKQVAPREDPALDAGRVIAAFFAEGTQFVGDVALDGAFKGFHRAAVLLVFQSQASDGDEEDDHQEEADHDVGEGNIGV